MLLLSILILHQVMITMKINKSYIPFAITCAVVVAAIVLSKPTPKAAKTNDLFSQYENRIKEFYSGNDLIQATTLYSMLVSSGMNPSDAYKIIGCG